MSKTHILFVLLAALIVIAPASQADWVDFVEETSSRISAPSNLVVSDDREKDFDWGDVDNDGDTDLVIVRKQPFTSAGKNTNVLLLNVNGVLTDFTQAKATASDVVGDEGFKTPTNDRDVKFVDVNNDGWLDMVTATTISVGDPKHIGHPRIYMNQCCSVGGCEADTCTESNWLGFEHQDARIPEMTNYDGQFNGNPCFCSVSFGDLTGDGYPELYFGDYDSGSSCSSNDFNDRLLVNQGALNPGFFIDATQARLSGNVPNVNQPFEVSAFGAANQIGDLNGDGTNDIIKQTSLNAPTYVGTAFNPTGNPGFFDTYDSTYTKAPYFVSGGDLNNDDKMDMIITDDGADRYLLNDGNSGLVANFSEYLFDYAHQGGGSIDSDDQGFGGNSLIADLNNDGWNDAIITDVDVDITGCGRRTSIYRNLTSTPGAFVELEEQTSGTGCGSFQNSPDCIVASISAADLKGTHDIAVFDIDGNGWLDMVVGRCDTTEVYMNLPPGNPAGAIGDSASTQLRVDIDGGGDVTLNWGESCIVDDSDYAVYQGRIVVPFDDHGTVTCSTGGALTHTFTPLVEDSYYLVVPHNSLVEGDYGRSSAGAQRPQGANYCFPRNLGSCD